MKAIILFASCMVLNSGFALDTPPSVPSGKNAPLLLTPEPSSEPRFDLVFPGGTVRAFIGAVTKATGKPVNIIIPKDAESAQIPAVEVSGVTVGSLFRAITSASESASPQSAPIGFGGSGQTPRQTAGIRFFSQEPLDSPDALWIFQALSSEPSAKEAPSVQYFPIAQFLGHFTVDDITTAIQSGCNLQTGTDVAKNPPPTLKFHEETKLLICSGTVQQLDLITQVLAGLSQMLQLPRTDNFKNTRKANEIILPQLDLSLASVSEAVTFIRKRAVELDPEKKGINIVVNGDGERSVTLSLYEVPVIEALEYVAKLGGFDLEKREHAIVLDATGTAGGFQSGGGGARISVPERPGTPPRVGLPAPSGLRPPTPSLPGSTRPLLQR